jgi:formate dehydrogenase beta subunit
MQPYVYGVWDGAVLDARTGAGERGCPPLAGIEDVVPDTKTKAFISDRGFLVLDETTCLAEAFSEYLAQAANESCGRCTPCRVGTQRLRDILKAVSAGSAESGALDEARVWALQITQTSLCGMGQNCARALHHALLHFAGEFTAMTPAQAVFQHSFVYTTAPCIEACPSKIDAPKYIDGVKNGKFDFALGVVLDKYPLAATCGRVCVRFCEDACRRNSAEGAVGIRMLKRYAADQALSQGRLKFTPSAERQNKRVAVIGAGPAGITCAYQLLLAGIDVDVFDAQRAAGGMASIGIPSYRLPKNVLKAESEDIVRQLGGHFYYGKVLGRDFSIDDLTANGYDAVFLGYGASKATQLGIRNEELLPEGYASGVDFLMNVHKHVERVEPGEPFELPGDVVVVGGGNVAMDCVRSARRMGAKSVHLVYRRTLADMPADREEVHAAEQEGIVFHCLTNPSELVIEDDRVIGVKLVQMRQTEVDARGRRGVEPIHESETFMSCDWLIAAIGQVMDDEVLKPEEGVELDRWNCVKVNEDTLETSRPGVFAGGDCVLGPLTLVNALDHGERAAASIRDYLLKGRTRVPPERYVQNFLARNKLLADKCLEHQPLKKTRACVPELDAATRIKTFDEVDGVISKEAAYEEASRCLRCYRLYSLVTEKPVSKCQHAAAKPQHTIAG